MESPARGGRGRGQERGRGGRGRGEVRGSGRGRGGQGQRSEHGHEPPQGGVEYPAVVTALVDQAVKPVAAQTSGLAGLGEYSSASGSDDGSSDSGSDSSDTSDSSDSADTAADGEGPEATPLEAEATVGPIKPICRFFAKTGRCKHGDRCKFLHSVTLSGVARMCADGSSDQKAREPCKGRLPPSGRSPTCRRRRKPICSSGRACSRRYVSPHSSSLASQAKRHSCSTFRSRLRSPS